MRYRDRSRRAVYYPGIPHERFIGRSINTFATRHKSREVSVVDISTADVVCIVLRVIVPSIRN